MQYNRNSTTYKMAKNTYTSMAKNKLEAKTGNKKILGRENDVVLMRMFGQITAITILNNIQYDILDIVTPHPCACLPKNTQKCHLICFVLLRIDAIKEFGSLSYIVIIKLCDILLEI